MALARADIIRAAIEILDAQGLDGVSTRAIAAKLGIAGPSLYWHFRNKDELIDHMGEAILAEGMPSPDPHVFGGAWQVWLAEGARAIRGSALAHRDGALVISRSKPTGTHPVIGMPAMIKRLEESGFTRAQAANALLVLGRFSLGWALDEQMRGLSMNARADASFEFGLRAIIVGIEAQLGKKKTVRPRRSRATS